jgi:arylsulfatase A-like enzyme
MDLLPTISKLSGATLHSQTAIDGLDISGTFTSDSSPRDELVYYSSQGKLDGIRIGDWKYLEPRPAPGKNKKPSPSSPLLFNLAQDIGEQVNRASENPGLAAQMKKRMTAVDQEVTANARSVWRVSDRSSNEN